MDARIAGREARLNTFNAAERRVALEGLAELLARGEIAVDPPQPAVNMHCHTFFSYNAYGHSPSSLAWLAKKSGYTAVGIVDFDVLDAVDEFLDACELLGVRGSAGIETRVFVPEFATREINSPGEPGVLYHMGIGFTSSAVPPEAEPVLASMRERAARRNREMLDRINRHLEPLSVDYEGEVLPLTPSGNATERHMLAAIIAAAQHHFPAAQQLVDFWSAKLATAPDAVAAAMTDYAKFSNLVRAKLMKQGGVGYVKPSPEAFPTVDEFHSMILSCGALPCAAWLDGMSAGEQAIDELLRLLMAKGVVALNIIPDRNWNLPEGETRATKIRKLNEIVETAKRFNLPINVGTEMNSPGNRLIDDFSAAPMAPLSGAFLAGAYFIYGHTAMERAAGLGFQSEWARMNLPDRRARNQFYEAAGRRADPQSEHIETLSGVTPEWLPNDILDSI